MARSGPQRQSKPTLPQHLTRQAQHLLKRFSVKAALLGIGIGGIVFVIVGVVIFLSLYGYYQIGDLILPGVHVGDIALGGMNQAEAIITLNDTWNQERGLIVTDGERSWYIPPSQIGLSLNPTATAQEALNVGHGQDFFTEMLTFAEVSAGGQAVEPVATVDPVRARQGLEELAQTVNLPAQNAGIDIQGDQVVAVPGRAGVVLNVEDTLIKLLGYPGFALGDGYLRLVLNPVAPAITDVGPALADAERLLSSSLTIQGYDPITDEHVQWSASREEIAGWLAVEQGENGPQVVVDPAKVGVYLDGLNAQLGEERGFDAATGSSQIEAALESGNGTVNLIIVHAPTIYTVVAGDTLTQISWKTGIPYWRILEANPGMTADTPLDVGDTLTIPSKNDLLPLPVVINKRLVVDIGKQRLYGYESGVQVFEYIISTGIDRSPTQPGIFQVQTHEESAYASVWDLTMPHFIGIYESWPGFMNGFHGLPSRDGGQVLWADSLGRKTSFGCIILNLENAAALFVWAENGVVVEIVE